MTDMTVDNPTISSMDVNLSISTTASRIFEDSDTSFTDNQRTPLRDAALHHDPAKTPTNKPIGLSYKSSTGPANTPQKRASQVFGFIKKRASKFTEKDERDLPDPPSSSSSNRSGSSRDEREVSSQLTSRLSSESSGRESAASKKRSSIPVYAGESATPSRPKVSRRPSERIDAGGLESMSRMMMKKLSFNRGSRSSREVEEEQREEESQPESTQEEEQDVTPPAIAVAVPQTPTRHHGAETEEERAVRILMTGPTKVIVTAPTPGTSHYAQQNGISLSRIPRGPRTPNSRRRRTSLSDREERRRHRQERAERENVRRERGDREKDKDSLRHRNAASLDTTTISTPRKKVSTRNFSHQSSGSVSSTASNENTHPNPHYNAVYAEAKRFVESGGFGGLGVTSEIPMTPLRVSKRTSVNQYTYQPPTPRSGHSKGSTGPASGHWQDEERREERRRPRGERGLYAGVRSGGSSTRQYRV